MIHVVFILWGLLCPGPTFPPVTNTLGRLVVTMDDDDSGDETGHIPPVPPIPPPPPRP